MTRTLTQSLNDAVKLIKEQTGSPVNCDADITWLKNGNVRVRLNMLIQVRDKAELEQP